MRTSILQYIAVCLLIARFASGSNFLAAPSSHYWNGNSIDPIRKIVKLNWDSHNLSKNHYAPRNSDSDYLKAFKDHLRYLHDNLGNLTLECCRENRNDKAAICDPKIVKPSEEVKIKDKSTNRREETGILGTGVHCGSGRVLGNACNRIDGRCENLKCGSKEGITGWFNDLFG